MRTTRRDGRARFEAFRVGEVLGARGDESSVSQGGVDDLDKSASLVVGATSRRSTSSLDETYVFHFEFGMAGRGNLL